MVNDVIEYLRVKEQVDSLRKQRDDMSTLLMKLANELDVKRVLLAKGLLVGQSRNFFVDGRLFRVSKDDCGTVETELSPLVVIDGRCTTCNGVGVIPEV